MNQVVRTWQSPVKAFLKAAGREDLEVPDGDIPKWSFPKDVLESMKLFGAYIGYCLAKEGLPLPNKMGGQVAIPINAGNWRTMYKYARPNAFLSRDGRYEDWDVEGWVEACDYDEVRRGYELFRANSCDWEY